MLLLVGNCDNEVIEKVYQVKSSRKYYVLVTDDYKAFNYLEALKYGNEF